MKIKYVNIQKKYILKNVNNKLTKKIINLVFI